MTSKTRTFKLLKIETKALIFEAMPCLFSTFVQCSVSPVEIHEKSIVNASLLVVTAASAVSAAAPNECTATR